MNIRKQSLKVINGLMPMEHIEMIGRICYKSEDKIADGTAAKFVNMLYSKNHQAMLEHYRFIMEVTPTIFEPLSKLNLKHFQFTMDSRYVISFNARALINLVEDSRNNTSGILPLTVTGIKEELIGHICRAYGCYELFGKKETDVMLLSTGVEFISNSPSSMSKLEWNRHGWKSVHFITDRGISHELVRHRDEASFAQESTRYCNYGLDKFGKEITVIDQGFTGASMVRWHSVMRACEDIYFELLEMGETPQMARSVLPTCLKTEIVITAPIYEWNHIIDLRYHGVTGAPHPMIKELLRPLVEEGILNYED